MRRNLRFFVAFRLARMSGKLLRAASALDRPTHYPLSALVLDWTAGRLSNLSQAIKPQWDDDLDYLGV